MISVSYRNLKSTTNCKSQIHGWCIIIISEIFCAGLEERFRKIFRTIQLAKHAWTQVQFFFRIAANYYSRLYVPCQSFGNSIVQSRRPFCISACCCLCSCALPPNSRCWRKIVAVPAGILIRRDSPPSAVFRCLPISRA